MTKPLIEPVEPEGAYALTGPWARWLRPRGSRYVNPFLFYLPAKHALHHCSLPLAGLRLRAALYTKGSNCDMSLHDDMHFISGEVPSGNGYLNGGKDLTGVSFDGRTLYADNVQWIAEQRELTARFVVYYVDCGAAGRAPLCHYLLRDPVTNVHDPVAKPGEPLLAGRADRVIFYFPDRAAHSWPPDAAPPTRIG